MASRAGAAEYLELSRAFEHQSPACRDDWRYIQDREYIDEEDLDRMARTCRGACPLFDLCHAYAAAAKPNAGMWAGRYWGRKERATT